MTIGEIAIQGSDKGAAVTLLYLRPDVGAPTELDGRLAEIARRYQPHVVLRTVGSDEAEQLTGAPVSVPRLVVMRRGEVVGQAMGATLPTRELDRVVRCAVEWD